MLGVFKVARDPGGYSALRGRRLSMGSLSTRAAHAPGSVAHVPPPRCDDPAPSTSELVVELAQLRYTARARVGGDAGGLAAAADDEFRTLLRRRDAVLAELRRRGLDFPDEHVEQARPRLQDHSVLAGPNPDSAASADLAAMVEHLERGLASRTVIGQAQGILIERHKVTPDAAFRMLVHASNVTNRKLRDIAADLVVSGELAGRR